MWIPKPSKTFVQWSVLVLALVPAEVTVTADEISVDYRRRIQPVLSRNCFACHGPDSESRQAELRLDQAESIRATGAVIPGQPEHSPLIARITSTDPDLRMPPPQSGRDLTDSEIELLRQWIQAGAPFESHWAFLPVSRPDRPAVSDSAWARQELDEYILAELEAHGLSPMPEADRQTLLRRVSLDLTGLPPRIEDMEAFLADTAEDAYDRVVDRLLKSPQYGEHLARIWLDAARYADTFGLHEDDYQSVWPYRDWVVRAFNDNMPFDRFTVEQLAGDLLPQPTTDQLVATGFNRCHVSTNEGGVIDEEFLVRYAVDRTSTTATVWMGLTAGCAACHDHKFDPLSMREFYSLMAFFNNVDENGRNGGFPIEPALRLWKDSQRQEAAELEAAINRKKTELSASESENGQSELRRLEAELTALQQSVPVTMIMRERAVRRPDHILVRGQYDLKGEPVTMSVPTFLPPLDDSQPRSRLALAQWLCSPEHPLTSRVTVNRFWQQVFGAGIVETADDFGVQGALPSHPELLDFLAWKFMSDGWDVRRFLRMLVTSATYRQDSRVTAVSLEKDPLNRLLSRGARFRLEGEVIRDRALAVSGLLSMRMEGPPVKPYQPPGLWEAVAHHASKTAKYQRDSGESLYRRSLYTFWKRGAPPPTMQIFDAPNRDFCVVRRDRTNTPLQALLTMNDEQFVEAARFLAAWAMSRDAGDEDRLTSLFRTVICRRPVDGEMRVLNESLHRFRRLYRAQPGLAEELMQVGDVRTPEVTDPVELATWTMVCNQLMNLDEFVMKE